MRSYGTRNGYSSHCRGQYRKLSSSKSNAQPPQKISPTHGCRTAVEDTLICGFRYREMSRNVRTSQVGKDMQSCKCVEMMMRSEVVGRHETVEDGRVLARQLSIRGICHGQQCCLRGLA
jgi:hypothetical protein